MLGAEPTWTRCGRELVMRLPVADRLLVPGVGVTLPVLPNSGPDAQWPQPHWCSWRATRVSGRRGAHSRAGSHPGARAPAPSCSDILSSPLWLQSPGTCGDRVRVCDREMLPSAAPSGLRAVLRVAPGASCRAGPCSGRPEAVSGPGQGRPGRVPLARGVCRGGAEQTILWALVPTPQVAPVGQGRGLHFLSSSCRPEAP